MPTPRPCSSSRTTCPCPTRTSATPRSASTSSTSTGSTRSRQARPCPWPPAQDTEMRRPAQLLAAAALSATAGTAAACGYCIEDKIAAVYDHAVVTAAIGQKHQVAFFAVDGPIPAEAQARTALQTALSLSRGIDAGSLRLSVESASLSFAFDGTRIKLAIAQFEVERRLKPFRLS